MDLYSIHITFDEGQAPHIDYNLSDSEFQREKEKWSKDYNLELVEYKNYIYYYKATKRR